MKQKDLRKHLNKNKKLLLDKRNFLLGKPSGQEGSSRVLAMASLFVIAILLFAAYSYFSGDKTGEETQDLTEVQTEAVQAAKKVIESGNKESVIDMILSSRLPKSDELRGQSLASISITADNLKEAFSLTDCIGKGNLCNNVHEFFKSDYNAIEDLCEVEVEMIGMKSYEICRKLKRLMRGKTCESDDECGDLICSGTIRDGEENPTCQDKQSDGFRCRRDLECKEWLVCNIAIKLEGQGEEEGTCEVHQDTNGKCDGDGDCVEGLFCSDFFTPEEKTCQERQGIGGACYYGSQCTEGLICTEAVTADFDTCQEPQGIGNRCEHDSDCEKGLKCNQAKKVEGAGDYSFEGTCQVPKRIGEICEDNTECEDELTCNEGMVDREGKPTCQYPQEEGEPCGDENDCERGLQCNQGILNKAGQPTCLPQQEQGKGCEEDDDCKGLECNEAMTNVFGMPTCQPKQGIGGKCESTYANDCMKGLICNNEMGRTCQAPQSQGGKCGDDDDCQKGLTCNRRIKDEDDSPTCQSKQEEEGICSSDRDCEEGFVCIQRKTDYGFKRFCEQKQEEGKFCLYDRHCVAGLTCNRGITDDYNNPTCQPKQDMGGKCSTDDNACGENLFCNRGYPSDGEPTCQPKQGRGGKCGSAENCEKDLVCNEAMDERRNIGECQPKQKQRGKCSDDYDCEEGLECVLGVCGGELLKQGNVCSGYGKCQNGLVCTNYGESATDTTCEYPSREGEICGRDGDCDSDYLVCNEAFKKNEFATCQPKQPQGGKCARVWFEGECQDGLNCNEAFKKDGFATCQPMQDVDQKCGHNDDCETGTSCNPGILDEEENPTCQPKQEEGGFCDDDDDCVKEEGIICNTGIKINDVATCQYPGPEGTKCGWNNDACEGDLRCLHDALDEDGEETCGLPKDLDEPCSIGECMDGLKCPYDRDSETGKYTFYTCLPEQMVGSSGQIIE
ncbi:hypothetical protein ACFL0W_00945 [Nanoarchaeota archaeon]